MDLPKYLTSRIRTAVADWANGTGAAILELCLQMGALCDICLAKGLPFKSLEEEFSKAMTAAGTRKESYSTATVGVYRRFGHAIYQDSVAADLARNYWDRLTPSVVMFVVPAMQGGKGERLALTLQYLASLDTPVPASNISAFLSKVRNLKMAELEQAKNLRLAKEHAFTSKGSKGRSKGGPKGPSEAETKAKEARQTVARAVELLKVMGVKATPSDLRDRESYLALREVCTGLRLKIDAADKAHEAPAQVPTLAVAAG